MTDSLERSLADLQRGRTPMAWGGRSAIEDLRLRIVEAKTWCAAYVDADRPATCLRHPQLAPPLLPRDRWDAVETVVQRRRSSLRNARMPTRNQADGRVVAYWPDLNLYDGAAEAESRGVLDGDNVPPWDTWIGWFDEGPSGGPPEAAYLLAWVPAELVPWVDRGVDVNPEECIRWLDTTDVAMRATFGALGSV